jgi:hypothetical protein
MHLLRKHAAFQVRADFGCSETPANGCNVALATLLPLPESALSR